MRSLLVILLGLFAVSPLAAQEDLQLEAARNAASTGDHARAVDLYKEAFADSDQLADDWSHELGTELTWADRPAEAIPWFERRLEAWPVDIDARLGLARALSWTDQLEEAWFQYRIVYYIDEGNLEARRGEARMLAWMDQLEESLERYDAILEDHPGDVETRIEHAQVINWRGEHFRAARLYEEILQDDPGNPQAMVGLAQALRWSGHERQAMLTLDPIREYPTASPLYRDLQFAARPYIEPTSNRPRDGPRTPMRWRSSLPNWPGRARVGWRLFAIPAHVSDSSTSDSGNPISPTSRTTDSASEARGRPPCARP
jgi:tetratricopeptide (TPR) repeat protein